MSKQDTRIHHPITRVPPLAGARGGEIIMDADAIIQAAARVLMRSALAVLQEDSHHWQARPCQTCRAVSSIVAQPFGCVVKLQALEGAK